MKRLLIALFALSLTMAFVLQACGDDEDDEEEAIPGAKFGGTLRIVPEGSIQAIHIQNTTSGVVQNVRWHVAEGLFQTDRNIALQPMLVDEWSKSSGELTWRFTLRDVKFQNGEKVTADDVVGSFARVQDNLGVWKLLRKTFNATIEADGDKVVVVRVSEPTALVLDGLHSEQNFPGPIVPKEFYPGFPILGVFRLNGQPKRDDGMIFGSCKAIQSPVYPIRDAILAVNHASCPSLSSSGPPPVG